MGTDGGQPKEKNLMAVTWTESAKVRRVFKGGAPRKRDLVLSPSAALLEGAMVFHSLQAAMREAGLPEDDVRVSLVLVTGFGAKDDIHMVEALRIDELPKSYGEVKALEGVWLPVGLSFWQLDRELPPFLHPAGQIFVWTQHWLTGDGAATALLAATVQLQR